MFCVCNVNRKIEIYFESTQPTWKIYMFEKLNSNLSQAISKYRESCFSQSFQIKQKWARIMQIGDAHWKIYIKIIFGFGFSSRILVVMEWVNLYFVEQCQARLSRLLVYLL